MPLFYVLSCVFLVANAQVGVAATMPISATQMNTYFGTENHGSEQKWT